MKGLLDTLTSTAESKDCPGICVHSLTTIICYDVLEDIPCPSPSMRCCVESNPANSTIEKELVTRRPATTTTTTTTKRPTTKSHSKPSKEKNTLNKDNQCPGVCVADRIAEYCEAYHTTSGLCKVGSKCCVSRDIYPDKLPADLYVPSTLFHI